MISLQINTWSIYKIINYIFVLAVKIEGSEYDLLKMCGKTGNNKFIIVRKKTPGIKLKYMKGGNYTSVNLQVSFIFDLFHVLLKTCLTLTKFFFVFVIKI